MDDNQGNPPPMAPPPSYTQSTGVPPSAPVTQQPPFSPPVGYAPPTEPPPQYEMPKDGPYAPGPPPGSYYPPQGMQGQAYPTQAQAYPATVGPAPGACPSGYGTVHQTIVVHDMTRFGPHPLTMECPNCHAAVTTSISYSTGGLTWLTAGLICLFGCWAGCCLIPFCIPDLQDVHHRCPNCSRHIGTYSRL